jgi:polysaccharide transporter, PST family
MVYVIIRRFIRLYLKWIFLLPGFIRHTVIKNALALYAVTFINYLLPLVTIPYLARVLGPQKLGIVLLAQTLGIWLSLIIEYGFGFSAARDIAQKNMDQGELSVIVSGVLGAKACLSLIAFILTFLLIWFIPIFHSDPIIFWLSFINCIALGFSPFWYFQGIEFLAIPALINISFRLLGLIPIFIWVRQPADAWLAIAFQSSAAFLSTMFLILWMYKLTAPIWPRLKWIKNAFCSGWHLFLFSFASSLYSTANLLILGLLVPPVQVGYYGGAERIHKAFSSLFSPIGQAFYPYITRTLVENKTKGILITQKTLMIMLVFGIAMGLIISIASPYWVRLILGDNYTGSVRVLLVLAIQLPLTSISRILGSQWMLPLNMDKYYSAIVIIAGLLNILLAVILVPHEGIMGMAWAFVLTELFVTTSMCYLVKDTGLFRFNESIE